MTGIHNSYLFMYTMLTIKSAITDVQDILVHFVSFCDDMDIINLAMTYKAAYDTITRNQIIWVTISRRLGVIPNTIQLDFTNLFQGVTSVSVCLCGRNFVNCRYSTICHTCTVSPIYILNGIDKKLPMYKSCTPDKISSIYYLIPYLLEVKTKKIGYGLDFWSRAYTILYGKYQIQYNGNYISVLGQEFDINMNSVSDMYYQLIHRVFMVHMRTKIPNAHIYIKNMNFQILMIDIVNRCLSPNNPKLLFNIVSKMKVPIDYSLGIWPCLLVHLIITKNTEVFCTLFKQKLGKVSVVRTFTYIQKNPILFQLLFPKGYCKGTRTSFLNVLRVWQKAQYNTFTQKNPSFIRLFNQCFLPHKKHDTLMTFLPPINRDYYPLDNIYRNIIECTQNISSNINKEAIGVCVALLKCVASHIVSKKGIELPNYTHDWLYESVSKCFKVDTPLYFHPTQQYLPNL